MTFPSRHILLVLTVERARVFEALVAQLQGVYGTRSVVETLEMAVVEAVDRRREEA